MRKIWSVTVWFNGVKLSHGQTETLSANEGVRRLTGRLVFCAALLGRVHLFVPFLPF